MASQSAMDILISGGLIGIFIYVVLLILSIIAVYIFFERYSAINRSGKIDQHFMNNIRSNVAAGNIAAARALCQATDSPVSRLVEKGLQRIGKPLRDIDAAVENAGNLEVFRLEKNLSSLASIAGAAPMVGFFGTVTGMILAFYNMASQESVTPSLLAVGIYQALLTTAFGLAIGIFAFVGYNLLVSKVDKVIYMMERTTTEFMDMLHE
jgi:biopolymer transport protein ExbB